MNEPPGARPASGRSALAMTGVVPDEKNQDVRLFIDNLFRFSQAGSRFCLTGRTRRGRYQPSSRPEMGDLQSELPPTNNGSITSVQAVYVPADDLTRAGAPLRPRSRHLDSTIGWKRGDRGGWEFL